MQNHVKYVGLGIGITAGLYTGILPPEKVIQGAIGYFIIGKKLGNLAEEYLRPRLGEELATLAHKTTRIGTTLASLVFGELFQQGMGIYSKIQIGLALGGLGKRMIGFAFSGAVAFFSLATGSREQQVLTYSRCGWAIGGISALFLVASISHIFYIMSKNYDSTSIDDKEFKELLKCARAKLNGYGIDSYKKGLITTYCNNIKNKTYTIMS